MKTSLPLFENLVNETPTTQGIKYAGSKLKLIPYILKIIRRVDAKTILDGFSGTTRVSQSLAQQGYQVVSNDISVWSEVFGTCYLLNDKPSAYYKELIDYLNALPPTDGWFTEHYGGLPNDGSAIQQDGLKKPWQIHNTRKLDAIRQEIENLSLPTVDKAVALTSLILALDEVDSTLGHFTSYLKDWSPRSYKELVLRPPMLFQNHVQHAVHRGDIFDVAPQVPVDLAYFDPPYGSNNEKMPPSRVRYASYYHLWTSICLFDKPDLFGKARRRTDTSDVLATSVFEEFRKNKEGRFIAVQAIDDLIKSTQARWVLLSYSSGGRATSEELNKVLRHNGHILDVIELNYKKNVMASMKWTNAWLRDADEPNREFLFLLEKK